MAFFKKKEKTKQEDVKQEQQDESIVSRVQAMYKTAYTSKGKLHDKWKNNYKAYTGELFEEKIPDYRSNEVSNYIFSTIETIKPIMLTNNPKTQIIPQQSIFYDKARTVQAILDSEWKRTNMFAKLHLFNHLNLIYGTAISGIVWNGKSRNGLGDVESVVISPFNFLIEPSATDISNAEYVMYATYKKASEIISAYPDKAEEIKAQTTTEVDENLMFGNSSEDYGSNNVLYVECYLRDYATETYVEDEIEEGQTVKYQKTRMKYPKGRRVIIAGDTLLVDEENPYDDGKFPFVAMRCYPQHGTFWGISEVEMLVSPQKHANRIMNGIIENALLNGNPWTVIDSNSGIERNSLSNRPGLVLRRKPGTNIERVAPPPLPSYIENVVGTLKQDMENISGVYDVMRGERPGSITAASAIQALNEQAQGRVKLKVQIMEDFISNIGSMWVRRVQQFWVTKRTIRVAGKPLETSPMDEGSIVLLQNGVPMNYLDVTKDDIDGDYDIEIYAGSTMQTNKSAIAQTMIQLAQTPAEDGMPMVDRRTVLENVIDVVDSINVQEVLDYFDTMKQQQAEASQSETAMLQEQEQMKMQQEMELEQMKEQHEMGIKNMEHASKISVENVKQMGQRESQEKQFKQDEKMASQEVSSESTLQSEGNEVKYNQDGQAELQEILDMLSNLSEEEYVELIQSNPEVAQLVEILLKDMEGAEQNA